MEVMDPSSLVHEPRLFVFEVCLEKSSILRGALQAAFTAWLASPAIRPIRVVMRIVNVVKRV
jgi:hypothetical protein